MSALHPVSWTECIAEPPPLRFILPGLLEGSAGLIVGQGAIGKTFLALEILRAVAMGDAAARGGVHGAQTLYQKHEIQEGEVGGIFGEDPPEVLAHRLHSLLKNQRLRAEDAAFLDQVCRVRSGVGADLALVTQAKGGEVVPGPFYQPLKDFCKGKKLVVIDPLLLLAGGMNEQDNTVMGQVMRLVTRIAHETRCAILVLHHTSKGGAEGREEQDRSRGASSITTSARLQIDMRKATPSEMLEFGIDESQRDFYVRVAQVKANYASPREACWLRKGDGGTLQAVRLEKVLQEPRVVRKGGVNATPF